MKNGKKVGYALGDMGISISYFVVGFFFLYYLTDIVGMNPYLAGLAFFIGKLWDGVNDPLMGILSDRTRSRFGRKRVFVLFGALPFAVSFVLLWMIPLHTAVWIQFMLAILAMMLYATAYTVVVVPYMALVPILTKDYDERTQITGLRAALSTVGTILGGSAALLLASFSDQLTGLRTITIAFGVFSLVALLVAGLSVSGVESGDHSNSTVMAYSWVRYLALLKDRDVLVLMAVKLLGAVATGSLSAALPYFAQHVLGDRGTSTYGLAAYVAVSAACIPVWNRLSRSCDKRRLLLVGNLITAVVLLAMGFLLQAGMRVVFYAGCVLLGMGMSSYLLIPYSLVPDLVDVYESRTGERHESVFFGLWITVHQLGISLSGLLIGFALSAFGYDGKLAVQTPAARQAIRVGFGVLPGLFFMLTAFVLQQYGISRGVYERARVELEARSGPRP
jgi:glycoside/pentoside/hexuronide:cation symporter, GPH family